MIIDRTQADVNNAISIRENKIQKFETLTDRDLEILERGFFTISTLNRIEEKQAQLANLLTDMGYWNIPIINKMWWENNIFNVKEFQRILDNTNVLRNAFFVYKNTPNTPPISYHFSDINALEKILYDLDVMINDVKSNYRFCGEFECGELI